jgi:DHA1 family inner membrane transport protein
VEKTPQGPALFALSLGYFTLGTASLAVVGLSAPIGHDLHVRPASVGLLVSVFAIVFAVAAPLAPIALSGLNRRHTLLLGLASAAGSAIVGEADRPRALATVFAGMTAVAVLGVPLASSVGNAFGWRWSLAGVVALTTVALALVTWLVLPLEAGQAPTVRVFGEVLRRPGAMLTVTTTLL